MGTRRPAVGAVMVVAGATLFAVNGTVSKLVLRAGIDPERLTTLRATGAFAGLLLAALLLSPGPRRLRVAARDVPALVAYGLTGFFATPALYFVAIDRLPVSVALLFQYTAPLLVVLWARFVRHEHVRPRLWAGLAASLVGLATVAQVWDGGGHLDGVGVLAALGAGAAFAAYFLLGAHNVRRRDTISLTTWAFGVSALAGTVAFPWWGFPFGVLGQVSAGVPVWALCLYVVMLGSIVPFALDAGALRHLPPTSVGIIATIEPVIAGAVAWVALDETLNAAQILGGMTVLVGVGLAETARAQWEPDETPVPGGA